MADKSVPQLNALTTLVDADLFHVNSSNIDYKLTLANLKVAVNGTSSDIVYKASLVVLTADVLTSFATPLLVVAAPAAGYKIEVVEASATLTFNSVAYATNLDMELYTDTATRPQFSVRLLNATVTTKRAFARETATGVSDTQLISAKGLYLRTATGNPITGDSNVTVYVLYRVVAD